MGRESRAGTEFASLLVYVMCHVISLKVVEINTIAYLSRGQTMHRDN